MPNIWVAVSPNLASDNSKVLPNYQANMSVSAEFKNFLAARKDFFQKLQDADNMIFTQKIYEILSILKNMDHNSAFSDDATKEQYKILQDSVDRDNLFLPKKDIIAVLCASELSAQIKFALKKCPFDEKARFEIYQGYLAYLQSKKLLTNPCFVTYNIESDCAESSNLAPCVISKSDINSCGLQFNFILQIPRADEHNVADILHISVDPIFFVNALFGVLGKSAADILDTESQNKPEILHDVCEYISIYKPDNILFDMEQDPDNILSRCKKLHDILGSFFQYFAQKIYQNPISHNIASAVADPVRNSSTKHDELVDIDDNSWVVDLSQDNNHVLLEIVCSTVPEKASNFYGMDL